MAVKEGERNSNFGGAALRELKPIADLCLTRLTIVDSSAPSVCREERRGGND